MQNIQAVLKKQATAMKTQRKQLENLQKRMSTPRDVTRRSSARNKKTLKISRGSTRI